METGSRNWNTLLAGIHPAISGAASRAPDLSVIVVNWNGRHFLDECLGSLQKQTFRDFEVILVDNGSTDGSVEFVRASFPEVKVVGLGENRGFSGGNNEGIRGASGRWVMLLNNDTRVHERCLEAVSRARERFPAVSMCAPKMLFYDRPACIDNCGFMATVAGNAWEIGRQETDCEEFNQYLRPFGPSGGAAFYRRDLLEGVGLLDEDFFMYYEDYDLAFRARLRGHECIHVPDAIVYHRSRGTSRALPQGLVYLAQRNIEYVYIKNMPTALMLRYGLHHLVYDAGGLVYFTRRGHLRSFLKAKWDALKAFPRLLRKRKEIQKGRALSSNQVRKLLVTNWFGLGVRKAFATDGQKWPVASLGG